VLDPDVDVGDEIAGSQDLPFVHLSRASPSGVAQAGPAMLALVAVRHRPDLSSASCRAQAPSGDHCSVKVVGGLLES
jgi:hypothetical protein